jgi:hypothetical protein
MRRALATVTIAGAVALVPFTATTAFADSTSAGTTVLAEAEVDAEPVLSEDGEDDTGRYGLIGLTGLFGLFGYKKYKEHRAATTRTTGTTGDGTTGGTSRRV